MRDVYDESETDVLLSVVHHPICNRIDSRCAVSPSILAAISSFTDNDIVLDTGAGVSVFKNTKHVVDIGGDHICVH